MKHRKLGKTGWNVSAVSMGCWGIGGQWGPVEERDAIAAIETARECGVNLFDTADAYGMGLSEEIVGKVLGKRPDDIYVATKVGNWGRRFDDDVLPFKSVHCIYESCHASLYRLKTDVIDLYQCHIQKPDHPDVFIEAFETLKQQGKIREYGISTDDLSGLEAMNASEGCATCQIRYSIFDRSAEKELFPYCLENNIGVLLRGPLAMGILTGKFSPETTFEDSVRERWNQGEAHQKFLRRVETAEKLKKLVTEERSLLDIALQFTLTQPAVTCSIPGMKNADQARSNTGAVTGELSHQDLAVINGICPPGVDL
jgi:aryl-alcohol dehydrogenase-like predicted oxidoreductase